MDKKLQKCPKNGGFPPFATPQIFFFKNRALSLLYPYGEQTSCKKLEKSIERSLRYLKTDQQTTEKGYYLGSIDGSKMEKQLMPTFKKTDPKLPGYGNVAPFWYPNFMQNLEKSAVSEIYTDK